MELCSLSPPEVHPEVVGAWQIRAVSQEACETLRRMWHLGRVLIGSGANSISTALGFSFEVHELSLDLTAHRAVVRQV